MPQEISSLIRAIGRWSLAALMLNTVIGASIFGLPSLLAAHLGGVSPVGYLVTAVGIAAIAACLAEVASQFRQAGGPYLYARVAFGRFAAIQVGWLTWLTRIVASAAAADLFVSYLAQFFPTVEWRTAKQLLHNYQSACSPFHRRRIHGTPVPSRRSCHSAAGVSYKRGLAGSRPADD